MKALMLAAGEGRRLGVSGPHPPKALLRFGRESLLSRHIGILRSLGVRELVLGVGHEAHLLEQEIAAIGATGFVRTVLNPDYRQGPVTTLHALGHELADGEPVIFMDSDVLYDWRLMARLTGSRSANCLLMDRVIDADEDPVRICLRGGRIVDFHKRPTAAHDAVGEWIGFARFSASVAARVAEVTASYVERGKVDVIYEEPIREVMLAETAEPFGIEDITGLPWIEIDYPEDLERARTIILPRLER